ncbi:unnamed protein product [marine sediment metagenome]|uniref:Uncharacterized protein n=1 Tax=marine sediment metagenome TaxID=412755 RepID=X0UWY5_9ZZZZ
MIDLEELGIDKKEYNKIVEKFPFVKELEDKINVYNSIIDGEYNDYDYEIEEIFKKIYIFIKERRKI